MFLTLALGALLIGCAKEPEPDAKAPESKQETSTEPEATPPTEADPSLNLAREPKAGDEVAVLETDLGKIVIMFYPEIAPKTVENFKTLVKEGFYDGTRFHRNILDFMIQGGDPKSKDLSKAAEWGTGGHMVDGAEVNVPAEFSQAKHVRGMVSMARSADPNSASSQFFIVQADSPHLDGQYTAFGYVVEGMDVVDKIVKTGDPANNGATDPKMAIVLSSATLKTWPLEGGE